MGYKFFGAYRIGQFYSALVLSLIVVLCITGCRDQGELLTIYSAELSDIETSAPLQDIRAELWRSGRNGNDQLVLTTLTNMGGRFEFAFFSVSGTNHYVTINASENPETNCKIAIMMNEGKKLHDIKKCKRSDYLLNLSLSDESKLLPIHRISIHVRNADCSVNFESFSTEDITDFSKYFEVFPESRYHISFFFLNSQNQILHSNEVEVDIGKDVVEVEI